jgi:hypothetical protein
LAALEFEPWRAELFAWGHVPIIEVLSELRAEETRLRGVGLLDVPIVLADRPPVAQVLPPYSAPPHLPTPAGRGGRSYRGGPCSRLFCG